MLERTYELLRWLVPTVSLFPRKQRYLVGDRIELAALDLLDLLGEAQASPETRRDALLQAGVRVDRLLWMLRLAHDLELLSAKGYEHGSRLLVDVGRQVGGRLARGRHARSSLYTAPAGPGGSASQPPVPEGP